MKIERTSHSMTFDFDQQPSRRCGDCQLCCKLMPVKEIAKRGNTRCRHQKHHKGCTIYRRPEAGFPLSCALWSCVWLSAEDAGALKRPDHCHFVVDPMPDYIEIEITGEYKQRIGVIQVWVDPAFPEAHRDAGLRAYLAKVGERSGLAALIRYSESDAWVLFPPALTPDGAWMERGAGRCDGDITSVVPDHGLDGSFT